MEKKYFTDWDTEERGMKKITEKILNDPDLPNLKSIVIGMWDCEAFDSDHSPDPIFEMMVNNKEKFQHIESLFVGDMTYEECEVSWIPQGNYEGLLNALPHLKSLKIKGANDLQLGKIDHKNLESLEIICGGLPVNVVNELKTANLPNLKSLVLYLGVGNYGYSCQLSDFAALAKKDRFPNLKTLGFVNAEEQDGLVKIILESDILPQLEEIKISCGCLTDKGGQLILDSVDKLAHLKRIDASYRYMSDEMMEKLKALPFEINLDNEGVRVYDGKVWRYPMLTE